LSERREYRPGTPCWVDLSSPELERSSEFYTGLFGWQAREAGSPEEAGGYTMFTLEGKQVAAVGPTQGEGQPPWWNMYVSVESADAAANKVREAGGAVLMEPFGVLGAGRMAILADPQGAIFCVWQPNGHFGAELVNQPGAFCWTELHARDPEAATGFYEAVFGWRVEPFAMPDTDAYALWMLGEKGVAGMSRMTEEGPPSWAVSFAVEDADATSARAAELGGEVRIAPFDTPVGRIAVIADPHGAVFAVTRLNRIGQ
jgi:uncharacterized protein